jgi:hypothetical protein
MKQPKPQYVHGILTEADQEWIKRDKTGVGIYRFLIPTPGNELNCPDARNIHGLLAYGERLGFDEARVRSIMKFYGFESFKVSQWGMYCFLLRWEAGRSDSLKGALRDYPPVCPVCGGAVEPDHRRDGMYGSPFAWRCLESKEHFIQYKVGLLKVAFDAKAERCETLST